jgi:hypothetical protein
LATQDNKGAAQLIPNPAAIAQSLSGFVSSRLGWIMFKSPYGTQTYRITEIETTSSDNPDVGLISDTTLVKFASVSNTISRPMSQGLPSKEDWIAAVKRVIGGYDDMLGQIIHCLYGFIENTVHGPGDVKETKPSSCFQVPFKGILLSGRPGTGKSIMASSLAEYSGLPFTVINCPDVFQTGMRANGNSKFVIIICVE